MSMPHRVALIWVFTLCFSARCVAQPGYLNAPDGQALFPIGFYELPGDDAGVKAMAEAGVNLVRCGNKADLDRVHAEGMLGWLPLSMQQGLTDNLRKQITTLKDHPALAVWEGPDEVIWNFTAWSGLYRVKKIHEQRGDWFRQTPEAIAYAKEQAATIIPNIHECVAFIREQDVQERPIWYNEANDSDPYYVRQYADVVDVIGCDLYPVKSTMRSIATIGDSTERWNRIGCGMPVWMVLQAFSWHELDPEDTTKPVAYASFAETRFMAYDVIAHGAEGILYWGSHYLKSTKVRQSLYALCSELATLQPFLVVPEIEKAQVTLVEAPRVVNQRGVAKIVREYNGEWLIVLINEDDHHHMGVEVTGLEVLDGRELFQLYGDEQVQVSGDSFMTRMLPRLIKVFSTSKNFESDRREGRDYPGEGTAETDRERQIISNYP